MISSVMPLLLEQEERSQVRMAMPAVLKALTALMDLMELADSMEGCGSDYQKLQEIAEQQAALEAQLEGLYQQWEELSMLLEEG